MDRLVMRESWGATCAVSANVCDTLNPNPSEEGCCCNCPRQEAVYERLADYEDTGLTPAEITQLQAEVEGYGRAKAEGRIITVPDLSQTTYYVIIPLNCEYSDCPRQDDEGDCDNQCPNVVHEISLHDCHVLDLLGLQLFLTREAAEAALAGREGGGGA